MKLSEEYGSLRKFNKKSGKYRDFRSGVNVETPRGLGIVVTRDREKVWVAHESSSLWCERFVYSIDETQLSAEEIAKETKLYRGAWQWIIDEAIYANQRYESVKHGAIFAELEPRIPGKRKDREVSMGTWGSTKYRRYTGVNKLGQPFDFELNTKPALAIPYGDRILFALGGNDGYITDMNGHGWIYRRKITDDDVNYGIANYAGPQEEAN